MSAKQNKGICEGCEAQCCRYVALEIDKPTCKRDYDNIRWYLLHEDVHVFVDNESNWNIEFKTRCSKLKDDGFCGYYNARPRICREHGVTQTCEFHADVEPHKIRFSTEKQFTDYLNHKGINWQWKRANPCIRQLPGIL